MKVLHPEQNVYLSLEELSQYFNGSYYSLLSQSEKQKLNEYLDSFEEHRHSEKIYDRALYKNLPFSIDSPTWKARVQDVKIIDQIIGGISDLEILDVGCWNGWLCNYYAVKGHQVVGTDIFTDPFDGLRSNMHYDSDFLCFQLPTEEIYRLQHSFDLIVFNRCWAYVLNRPEVLSAALKLLKEDGKIIFTGLIFYKNTQGVQERIEHLKRDYYRKYGENLFRNPIKGYLDIADSKFLISSGVVLKSYNPIKNNLKRLLSNSRPIIQYGIYHGSI